MVLIFTYSQATHIKSADIQAKLIDCENLKYQVIITIYTDTSSVIQFGHSELDFGDGSIIQLSHEDYVEFPENTNGIAAVVFAVI